MFHGGTFLTKDVKDIPFLSWRWFHNFSPVGPEDRTGDDPVWFQKLVEAMEKRAARDELATFLLEKVQEFVFHGTGRIETWAMIIL